MAIGTPTVGTAAFQNGTNPSVTPGIPAGAGATDLMIIRDEIIVISSAANTPAINTGTYPGWALLDTFTATNSSFRTRHTWFWRAGAPGTAPQITLSSSTAATQHRARMTAVPGAKISGADVDIFTLGTGSNPGSSSTEMGPITGLTTPEDGCLVLVGAVRGDDCTDGSTIDVAAQQSGFTLVVLDSWGTGASDAGAGGLMWAVVPTAVAVTDKSFSITAASSNWPIGQMISVRPEPTAAAPVIRGRLGRQMGAFLCDL